MERYDAAIIGAGPDGLIAAHRLSSAGLRVVVLEQAAHAGGPAATKEFHPGFRASRYCDELAPIPAPIIRRMDLPRYGAVLMPAPASICITPDRASVIYGDSERMARLSGVSGGALAALHQELESDRAAIATRAHEVEARKRFGWPWRRAVRRAWPGEKWGGSALAEILYERITDPVLGLHLASQVLSRSCASPFVVGSGLHLLRGLRLGGMTRGGLGSLGDALKASAAAAGTEIRLGCEVTDIRVQKNKANGVVLTEGIELTADAIISTLDLKRTFLCLLSWGDLPMACARRVAQFRTASATARIVFALDSIPEFRFAREAPEAACGPIHIAESLDSLSKTSDAWRAGVLSKSLPITLRAPSLLDPSLAPPGKGVLTATITGVPAKLFDGAWNGETRGQLAKMAVLAAERIHPGLRNRLVGLDIIIADDVERELFVTGGDLEGGELAPDQALGFRPFPEWQDARTHIRGLYLGGPSSAPSPFFTGLGGTLAAESLLSDLRRGHSR